MFAEHYLIRRRPRTWLTSGGAGTMGFGLPAAMGAKVAKPDVEVFDIDGDGSFQMTSQELATCKESGIKVTPIIFNNSYLGMVRQWLELFSEKRYSDVHFTANPDFVKLAQAYGLSGLCITRKSELDEALRAAIKGPETMLLDVQVELEENIFPILPPGGALQDIMGGKSIFKSMTFAKKIKK